MGRIAPPELEDRASLPPGERDALRALIENHVTLEDVIRWGERQAPPVAVADIVIQDEYTHDVVVPAPGDRGLYLVYDTT